MATYRVQFLNWDQTGVANDAGDPWFMEQIGQWRVSGRYGKQVDVNVPNREDSDPDVLELVWSKLQRIDNKNVILDEHGLRSMSVGDLIMCPNGNTMVARSVGFSKL